MIPDNPGVKSRSARMIHKFSSRSGRLSRCSRKFVLDPGSAGRAPGPDVAQDFPGCQAGTPGGFQTLGKPARRGTEVGVENQLIDSRSDRVRGGLGLGPGSQPLMTLVVLPIMVCTYHVCQCNVNKDHPTWGSILIGQPAKFKISQILNF